MTTNTAITPAKQIGDTLRKMNLSLPKHMASERFIQTIQTAVLNNPTLISQDTDRNSFYSACSKAAQDGLILDGREAALVVFKGKVQYMPMVAGIIKKVRNSGELSTIAAHVIYEKDTFNHSFGIKEEIEHIVPPLNVDRGKPIGVYAVGHLKDGSYQICVMDAKQVQAVKKVSKTDKIWEGPFKDQMWEKSAIRRLCKRMPMSSELERLFQHDNETFDLTGEPRRVEGEVIQGTDDTKAARVIKGEPEPEVEEPEPDLI